MGVAQSARTEDPKSILAWKINGQERLPVPYVQILSYLPQFEANKGVLAYTEGDGEVRCLGNKKGMATKRKNGIRHANNLVKGKQIFLADLT